MDNLIENLNKLLHLVNELEIVIEPPSNKCDTVGHDMLQELLALVRILPERFMNSKISVKAGLLRQESCNIENFMLALDA